MWKKIATGAAGLVMTAVALAAPAQADLPEILTAGKIKIAIPENFPPFGALGADGEYQGYDVDVANMIAQDLGVEIELVPVTSKQRIPFLETDRVDLVISSMGANPERAKSIWFSSAYAPFFSGAFAAAGMDIASVADLAGKKVGLTGGTLEDLELTGTVPEGTEIIRFGDNAATIAAYVSGQTDVLVTGNTVAAQLSADNPKLSLETKFIIKESPAFVGVKKGNYDLLQWVNVFILHKTLGGQLDDLSQKWLGQKLPKLPSL
jgi:polar amino acid transport system substrate-binding protein